MLNPKYKISNMSKEFGIKSKELVDILEKYGKTGKSHMATLTPEDFNIILNDLSLSNQVVKIDSYLYGETYIPSTAPKKSVEADNAPLENPVQAKEEKTEPKKEEKPANKTNNTNTHNADKAHNTQIPEKNKTKEPKKETGNQAPSRDNNPQEQRKRQDQKKKQPAQARPQMQILKPTPKHTEAAVSTQTIDSKQREGTRVKSRIVDTRSSNVDLSKYDERLERYRPDKDYGNNVQKLKKQNFRGQGKDKGRGNKERLAMEKLKRQQEMAKKQTLNISLPDEITVSELASRLKAKAADIVKKLMLLGVMASINDTVDYDTAYLIADEMGAKITKEVKVTIEESLFDTSEDSEESLVKRPPVVCVMGHVDHGKTSLLDAIRHQNVTEGEAGGITQHIGAYTVNVNGGDITFLDTPGHEAFTAMRARGAMATDIAVLVVAGDDGIMPQTIESINHAKAAGVDIIVAINKMDKPTANAENVKSELTKYDLVPEEWGGDVICVPVSAHTGMGINDLLENILLIAEVKDFKANPNRRAKGVVIEAKLDKGRGSVATVLVQSGTLHAGDTVIAGTSVGRVRAMKNDKGELIKTAGPSVPVEIIGLSEVPNAGDEFNAVEDEKMARELAEQRKTKAKNEQFKLNSAVSLDALFAAISDGVKDFNIIVKADVQGSAEAVKSSLLKLTNDEVRINVIHTGVGGITESDVMLATASGALIIGFNVRPDKNALEIAERASIEIRTYRVIYECIEEVTKAMKGMLAPEYKESLLGHAEVRQTIKVPNVGTIAGSYITDGKITRNALIRVIRDGIVIDEDKIKSLRRFKDDVKEVAYGYECGVGLDRFNDIREGDVLEAYEMVEVER
ncbi:MAG: translation initiation factor IF-2 [Clostridia bacterium]|nr:translation initiation factor IF-2 [Clostridia bacterium]